MLISNLCHLHATLQLIVSCSLPLHWPLPAVPPMHVLVLILVPVPQVVLHDPSAHPDQPAVWEISITAYH